MTEEVKKKIEAETGKKDPVNPPSPKTAGMKAPAKWGKQLGLSPAKVAGVCAWTGWDVEDSRGVSEAEFKKAADQWLRHAPGSGKRPSYKEVRK